MRMRSAAEALRSRPGWGDVALALALAALLQLELALADRDSLQGGVALNVVAGLAATLPLVARRAAPVAVLITIVSVLSLSELAGADITEQAVSGVLAIVPASYSIGRYVEGRRAGAGVAIAVAVMWVFLAAGGETVPADYIIVALLFVAAPAFAGRTLRVRHAQAQKLEQLTVQLEREQESRAATAVLDERARIARELHDVVAHSVSVIVVQAQAAQRVLTRDPAQAQGALRTIEDTGRGALVEMRRLLGVLRKEDEGDDLAPQPGLASLGELAARAREAGLPVELSVSGDARPLTPGVDLSAYRIVQEALTNTMKHAGPATATVRVDYGAHELAIEVADDGRGPAGRVNGDGHGLVGMRQRIELYRGRLETGPGESGGYSVRAWLPLDDISRP